ncbi:MAG: ParB/RepB/Spo0J family partition protein [Myxococcales bacterium]|nr:MAG: ParB/RepB/Spo0J family partition protein [Myxococcales bacterium]
MDSSRTPKRRPLGRGLDALLPSSAPQSTQYKTLHVAVEDLRPNSEQPRKRFDEEALEELASSIKELGVLEPLLVRKRNDGTYDIVAGERRWRAAQRAGVLKVPVFVRELTEKQSFEAALVENLQREDLNAVETARAFQKLIADHGHTQESVAKRLGKSRSAVANSVRLLSLPDGVLARIEADELSEGHGRALLGLASAQEMSSLAKEIVAHNLSVRDTEKRVKEALKPTTAKPASKTTDSANVRDLEKRLSNALGATVKVTDKKGKGQISIRYHSYDELDGLLERLVR